MDVRKVTESLLLSGIKRKLSQWGIAPEISFSIEIPRQEEHGDFSSNAAMQIARHVGKKARDVAVELAEAIRREDDRGWIASLSIAGPGFINIVLSENAWREVVATVLRKAERFGSSETGKGKKVLIEFVSASPTGPLHVERGRGAAVGDALARLLSFEGYKVVSEYYVNDVGNQMDNLGRSLLVRYRQECGMAAELAEDGYRGEYLAALAKEFAREAGDRYVAATEEEALPVFRKVACDRILDGIRKDLDDFRVRFDNWFSEESLHREGFVSGAIEELGKRDLLYMSEGAVFFKSETHGDEKDRVLVRADGRTTYFAADVAYHRRKYLQGYSRMIDIWGADHHGYAPRMLAAMRGMGEDENRLEILLVQFVTLVRDARRSDTNAFRSSRRCRKC